MDESIRSDDTPLVVEGRRSLAFQVYHTMLQGIVDGVFSPGERLIETDLTRRLDVSRTPLREALNRLSSEGFLRRLKGGGYEIVVYTRKEVEDIYDVRRVLEKHLIDLVIGSITEEEIDELHDLVERAQYHAERGTTERLGRLSDQFHHLLHRASRNDRLARILLDLERHASLFRIQALKGEDVRAAFVEDHREIVAAIACRDTARARAIMDRHVRRTCEALLRGARDDDAHPVADTSPVSTDTPR